MWPFQRRKNKVFVSYNHTDEKIARMIVGILRLKSGDVFFDRDSIPDGEIWEDFIEKSIKNSEKIIILWCSHSIQSSWVTYEYNLAIKYGIKIVPLLLDSTAVPAKISKYQGLDYRKFGFHQNIEITLSNGLAIGSLDFWSEASEYLFNTQSVPFINEKTEEGPAATNKDGRVAAISDFKKVFDELHLDYSKMNPLRIPNILSDWYKVIEITDMLIMISVSAFTLATFNDRNQQSNFLDKDLPRIEARDTLPSQDTGKPFKDMGSVDHGNPASVIDNTVSNNKKLGDAFVKQDTSHNLLTAVDTTPVPFGAIAPAPIFNNLTWTFLDSSKLSSIFTPEYKMMRKRDYLGANDAFDQYISDWRPIETDVSRSGYIYFAEAMIGKGMCMYALGRHHDSLKYLKYGIKVPDFRSVAYFYMIMNHCKLGNFFEAVRLYNVAKSYDSKFQRRFLTLNVNCVNMQR